MIRITAQPGNRLDMHARSTAKLVQLIGLFDSEVTTWVAGTPSRQVCLGQGGLMKAMVLYGGRAPGEAICFAIAGQDEQALSDALVQLIRDGFHEELVRTPVITVHHD